MGNISQNNDKPGDGEANLKSCYLTVSPHKRGLFDNPPRDKNLFPFTYLLITDLWQT